MRRSSDTTRKEHPFSASQLDFFDQAREEARRAAWCAVRDHDCLPQLAAAVREMRRWKCTKRTAESKVSKWISPDDLRATPGFLFPLITALTGEDLGVVSTQLQAVEAHRAMAKVEPEGLVARATERVDRRRA